MDVECSLKISTGQPLRSGVISSYASWITANPPKYWEMCEECAAIGPSTQLFKVFKHLTYVCYGCGSKYATINQGDYASCDPRDTTTTTIATGEGNEVDDDGDGATGNDNDADDDGDDGDDRDGNSAMGSGATG